MMKQSTSIPEMFNQSIDVITNPSVATFEKYEHRGTFQDAAIYVAIGAVISAVLGLITGGVGGLIGGFLSALVQFFIFTGLVFFLGQKMANGTGKFDEVAYTFSLFSAPLSIIGGLLGLLILVFSFIPILNFLVALAGFVIAIGLLVAQIYFAFTAVQSSMNIRDRNSAIAVLVLAGIGTMVINSIIIGIF